MNPNIPNRNNTTSNGFYAIQEQGDLGCGLTLISEDNTSESETIENKTTSTDELY